MSQGRRPSRHIYSVVIENVGCDLNFAAKYGRLRGKTVYVNFLVTISCSLNISEVYF